MLRCCSANVRVDTAEDGSNAWPHRRELFFETIRGIDPDVIGLQEPLVHQYEQIRATLPAYDWYGVGREGGTDGEFCPVGWRRSEVTVTDRATRWLAPDPTDVGAVGWDAACPRIGTRVRLETGSDDLTVWNTHLDHRGTRAREESASRLREWTDREATRVVLLGDFNCEPDSSPYRRISGPLVDARETAESVTGPRGTFHGFTGEPVECIDHLFVSPGIAVSRFETADTAANGRYPSDHFPIVADLRV